jgi:hypothetical protein
VPLSKDPESRSKQLANLRQNAATKHGAFSEVAIRPARERYAVELAEAFPSASAAEVAIQAQRLAQLEQLGAYLDERGVIRHKRRGDVFPAATLANQIASSFERQNAILMAREQSAGGDPRRELAAILAEHTTEGEDE